MHTALGILIVVALLSANALFVAVEFSLVSVEKDRIKSNKSYGANVAAKLLKRLTFHLTGAQLGITATALLLGFVAESTLGELIEPLVAKVVGESSVHSTSIIIALAMATIFHMVLGEQIPKIFAISKPLGTSIVLAPIFRIYSILSYPMVLASNGLANAILRGMGVEPTKELQNIRRREDLEEMFRSSGKGGSIDRLEVDLLTRSLYFGEKIAMDALVPRMAVATVDVEETLSGLVAKALDTGFSRFPITGGDLDDVRGVVHIKSAHKVPRSDWQSTQVMEWSSEVLAVPETLPLADLLRTMGRKRSPLAVVVDEHGGTSGIVTAEDVLEQIVGAIADEYDVEPQSKPVEDIGGGNFVFPGSILIEELKQSCGFAAPDGPFETLGGFVMYRLQRVPKKRELIGYKGWWFEVVEMDRHRIAKVKVSQPREILEKERAQ